MGLSDQLNTAILEAIAEREPNAYGVTIQIHVSDALSRSVSFGMIYTMLDLLEETGYVTSTEGEATAARGWRPKRYFHLTEKGYAALPERAREEAGT